MTSGVEAARTRRLEYFPLPRERGHRCFDERAAFGLNREKGCTEDGRHGQDRRSAEVRSNDRQEESGIEAPVELTTRVEARRSAHSHGLSPASRAPAEEIATQGCGRRNGTVGKPDLEDRDQQR